MHRYSSAAGFQPCSPGGPRFGRRQGCACSSAYYNCAIYNNKWIRLQTGIAAVKSYGNHDGDGGLVPGIRAISRCALAKQHEEVFLEGRAAPVAKCDDDHLQEERVRANESRHSLRYEFMRVCFSLSILSFKGVFHSLYCHLRVFFTLYIVN